MVPARSIEYLDVSVAPPAGVLLPRPLVAPPSTDTDQEPWWLPLVRMLPFR